MSGSRLPEAHKTVNILNPLQNAQASYAFGLWCTLGSKICQVSSRTWALKLMMLTHHASWLTWQENS